MMIAVFLKWVHQLAIQGPDFDDDDGYEESDDGGMDEGIYWKPLLENQYFFQGLANDCFSVIILTTKESKKFDTQEIQAF